MENQAEVFDMAIWLSLAILLTALGLWINIKHRYINPKLNDIRSAISWLKTNKPSRLDEFSDLMSNNKTLTGAWNTFRRTLFPESQHIIATHKAERYFNETVIDSGTFDIRFVSAIPGYLLSAGLMFTFIGLLLALNAAVALSQSGDLGASTLALQGLLGAAAFKFLTSISGLFSSILFSIALRKNMQESRNLLDTLCFELDSRLSYETSETITLRQMSEARTHNHALLTLNQTLAQQQTSTISKLTDAIGKLQSNIANNGQNLSNHAKTFERAITYLLDETKNSNAYLVSNMRQANQENLNSLVDKFVSKFDAATHSQFKEINLILATAQKNFSQVSKNLTTAGTQFQDDIATSGREIQNKITEASTTLNQSFGASADSMMKTTNNIGSVLESLHQVMDNLLQGTQAILEANKHIAPVSERFENTTRDFIAVIPQISGLTNHFKKFYTIFSDFNANMRSIDKTKVSELSELIEFSRKSTELVSDYHQSSLSANKDLRESIESFHALIASLDQGIKSIHKTSGSEKIWNQFN